ERAVDDGPRGWLGTTPAATRSASRRAANKRHAVSAVRLCRGQRIDALPADGIYGSSCALGNFLEARPAHAGRIQVRSRIQHMSQHHEVVVHIAGRPTFFLVVYRGAEQPRG